ncbi:MAG: DedA family protein [Dehalococcoidia bacterium]
MVFPGQVIMFIGGTASAKGDGNIAVVIAVASAGTILGDIISYAVGRLWAQTLLESRFGPALRVGEAMMEGRARWLIPFYHFYSVTRSVGPAAAGVLRLPLRIWLPMDIFGAVFFNIAWIGAGFVFGTAVLNDDGSLKESPFIRIGLAVIATAWFLVMRGLFERRMREFRAREAAERISTPVTDVGPDPDPATPDSELALREQGQHDSVNSR